MTCAEVKVRSLWVSLGDAAEGAGLRSYEITYNVFGSYAIYMGMYTRWVGFISKPTLS